MGVGSYPSDHRVIISINTAWNIANFRAGLVEGLQSEGYEVVCAAPPDAYVDRIEQLGARLVALPMDNDGTSPFRDFGLFVRYLRLFRRERPSAYLGFTAKPNIFGSIAAHLLGIPVINNVSGLGTAFIKNTWLTVVVKKLYRAALARSATVFFQNNDDRVLFVSEGLVDREKTAVLPGSGIDLENFRPVPRRPPGTDEPCVFLLIARLVYDKGVGEYVEAARLLKRRYPAARFQLLGFLNVRNRTAVTREDVGGWVADGIIEYLGTTDDVRPNIAAADCVVLPSYREGTPRTLLEAAAMGKPMIATDVPGCREPVADGENGFLCRVRDSIDLAQTMARFIEQTSDSKDTMGAKSREIAERRYDQQLVVSAYLAAIKAPWSEQQVPIRNPRPRSVRG